MARRWFSARRRGGALRKVGPRGRPAVEALEDRCVPSVLTVTSPLDDGSAGTLRAQVAAASPGDTIVFDPSLAGHTVTLTQGAITIDRSLTIQGPGADALAISGNNASRVFDVDGPGVLNVSIIGLKLAGGSAAGGGAVLKIGRAHV